MLKKILTNNRVKSFLWRTLMMIFAVVISQAFDNLDIIAPYVNPTTITLFGLVLGELSKALNNALYKTPSIKL